MISITNALRRRPVFGFPERRKRGDRERICNEGGLLLFPARSKEPLPTVGWLPFKPTH